MKLAIVSFLQKYFYLAPDERTVFVNDVREKIDAYNKIDQIRTKKENFSRCFHWYVSSDRPFRIRRMCLLEEREEEYLDRKKKLKQVRRFLLKSRKKYRAHNNESSKNTPIVIGTFLNWAGAFGMGASIVAYFLGDVFSKAVDSLITGEVCGLCLCMIGKAIVSNVSFEEKEKQEKFVQKEYKQKIEKYTQQIKVLQQKIDKSLLAKI